MEEHTGQCQAVKEQLGQSGTARKNSDSARHKEDLRQEGEFMRSIQLITLMAAILAPITFFLWLASGNSLLCSMLAASEAVAGASTGAAFVWFLTCFAKRLVQPESFLSRNWWYVGVWLNVSFLIAMLLHLTALFI